MDHTNAATTGETPQERANRSLRNQPAHAVSEAILDMVEIASVSELEKRLEGGRAVMDDRSKRRKKAVERKDIQRQAKGLVPALLCAHGASTAIEGAQSEVISDGIDASLVGVLTAVFPNLPTDGPSAGFPIRHLRSRIRQLHEIGKLDERQAKVLTCAVRKANNAIAGEHGKPPRNTPGDKPGREDKHEPKSGRFFRGPRKITETSLGRMPEIIRAAANRLKAKPARRAPASYAFSELLSADFAAYFDALESAGKGLGRRLEDYADVLRKHEHDRSDEERLLEWMVQFPVAPPETLRALLSDVFEWVQAEEKDERRDQD
jgi:hypothetical protein